MLETHPALRVTNTWDPACDVLLTKANELVLGETTTDVSSITYTVNPIGQRTHATRTGAATNGTEWGYDTLGQLETADDTNPAADRAYQYDSIGNRLSRSVGVPPTSTATYTPNDLNQYDAITEGSVTFTPTYDDDGNQKDAQILPLGSSSLAACVFVWDGENRLVAVKDNNGAALVSYAYDAFSRLVSRTTTINNQPATTRYLYDGWNRIAEYAGQSPRTTYIWGMDLSGTMQGAGGVGGLLSVSAHDPETGNVTSVHYPTCDGNGNITEYLTAAGAVAAHFEYDPFGNTLAATGDASKFEYRFSSKPQDPATGLLYYGYRFYDPLTGRWPSRDPIEERGGYNLYGFIGNDGLDWVDYMGYGEIVTVSGINALPNEGGPIRDLIDYVGKELEGHGINVKPDNRHHSNAGTAGLNNWNYICPGGKPFVAVPWSKSILDKEAQEYAARCCEPREYCKKKVCVVMIAPKTHTLPPKDGCCKLEIKVWWDPYDPVPNQGIFTGTESQSWWSRFGNAYPVQSESGGNHDFDKFTRRNPLYDTNWKYDKRQSPKPPGPKGGVPPPTPKCPTSGKTAPNPIDAIKRFQKDCDYTFVCHSQGCNITMQFLQRACKK